MCDNNNNGNDLNTVNSLIAKEAILQCHPCTNDVVGCQVSNIRHVMANNLSILTSYKNMKCAVLAYINAVSVEFVQNVDHSTEDLERSRFNVLIESLIAAIHQSVKSYTAGHLEPYFQLWIQDTSSGDEKWDIGSGSVNPYNGTAYCTGNDDAEADTCGKMAGEGGSADCMESTDGGVTYAKSTADTTNITTAAACVDACSDGTSTTKAACEAANEDNTWYNRYLTEQWNEYGGAGDCSDAKYTTREECLKNVDLFGNTNTWSSYSPGNLAKLYPNKIALFLNCNKENGVVGDEVLYHYNPSVQLLYNPIDSSLKLRWSDATYNEAMPASQKCLFPLLSKEDNYMSEVLTLVPPSIVGTATPGDDIWEDHRYAFNFIRKNCLLDNKDLHRFISQLDSSIRKCELAHQSLKLKLKMSAGDVLISELDPVKGSKV